LTANITSVLLLRYHRQPHLTITGAFPLLVLSSTTNFMTTTYQKLEILQSLNNLDAAQSEKVLNYIKGLLCVQQEEFYHHNIKRHRAMKEIGKALDQAGNWM
jgi:hypothetical protein